MIFMISCIYIITSLFIYIVVKNILKLEDIIPKSRYILVAAVFTTAAFSIGIIAYFISLYLSIVGIIDFYTLSTYNVINYIALGISVIIFLSRFNYSDCIAIAVTICIVGVLIYLNKIGGGDLEMIITLLLCVGYENTLLIIAFMFIFIGVHAIIKRIKGNKEKIIPMGPYLACSFFLIMFSIL